MKRKEWSEETKIKQLMDELHETKEDLEKVIVAIDWLKNVIRPNVEEKNYRYGENNNEL